MAGWLSIETAPKSQGDIVDLWVVGHDGARRVPDCFWATPYGADTERWVFVDVYGEWSDVGLATHWMPRPLPPPSE